MFNLDDDYHELHDLSQSNPEQYQRMSGECRGRELPRMDAVAAI